MNPFSPGKHVVVRCNNIILLFLCHTAIEYGQTHYCTFDIFSRALYTMLPLREGAQDAFMGAEAYRSQDDEDQWDYRPVPTTLHSPVNLAFLFSPNPAPRPPRIPSKSPIISAMWKGALIRPDPLHYIPHPPSPRIIYSPPSPSILLFSHAYKPSGTSKQRFSFPC